MTCAAPDELTIAVDAGRSVSALLIAPDDARVCLVLAHGAGAGMRHPFMASIAQALAERRIATLRYQFPYMEQGSRRPDAPALAHATVRAAVRTANQLRPDLALIAGGKSFGGRMTSQAQADAALTGVRGIVFVGFPLHPAGKPSDVRAEHLARVQRPMLFLQGTHDELAKLDLLRPVVEHLGAGATLAVFDDADHSFHVPRRSGRSDADVIVALADTIAAWIDSAVDLSGSGQPRHT